MTVTKTEALLKSLCSNLPTYLISHQDRVQIKYLQISTMLIDPLMSKENQWVKLVLFSQPLELTEFPTPLHAWSKVSMVFSRQVSKWTIGACPQMSAMSIKTPHLGRALSMHSWTTTVHHFSRASAFFLVDYSQLTDSSLLWWSMKLL